MAVNSCAAVEIAVNSSHSVYSPRNSWYGTWTSRVILFAQEVAVYSPRNWYGTWISRVILFAREVAVYSLGNSREFNKLRDNSRQENLLCFLCHTHNNFRQTKRDSRVFTHATTKRRVPSCNNKAESSSLHVVLLSNKADSSFQTITLEMCQQQAREVSSCASMWTACELAV